MNPVPITVSVNPGPPALVCVGDNALMVGTGLEGALTTKLIATEVPPPGAGLITVTFALPALTRSKGGTVAWSRVLETSVVVSAAPFHAMADPLTNPVPVADSMSPALPATADVGVIDASVGVGFEIGGAGLPEEAPPPQPTARPRHTAIATGQMLTRNTLMPGSSQSEMALI